MLYGGSIRPGHFKGAEVTIQQVFEAVGEYAAGQDHRAGAARARGGRLAGRGRVRRAVHRQHDGDGLRGARHLAGGLRDGAGRGRAQARGRRRVRRTGDGRPAPRPAPERRHHQARRSKTRSPRSPRAAAPPTACCTCWRSRAKWACRWRSTSSRRSPSARRCCATCSPAGSTSPPTSTRPAACRSCSRGCSKRAS